MIITHSPEQLWGNLDNIKVTRRGLIKWASILAGAATLSLANVESTAGDGGPGKTIESAIDLPVGVTYWDVKNSYHESNQLFFKLNALGETNNRYLIRLYIPRQPNDPQNSKNPSLDHITFDVFSPEQLEELRAWQNTKGDYPKPKGEASMETVKKDPNYNGGDVVLQLKGLQPLKGPWIGVLSYKANDNETKKNVESYWWGTVDVPLPDQVKVAIDTSTLYQ